MKNFIDNVICFLPWRLRRVFLRRRLAQLTPEQRARLAQAGNFVMPPIVGLEPIVSTSRKLLELQLIRAGLVPYKDEGADQHGFD